MMIHLQDTSAEEREFDKFDYIHNTHINLAFNNITLHSVGKITAKIQLPVADAAVVSSGWLWNYTLLADRHCWNVRFYLKTLTFTFLTTAINPKRYNSESLDQLEDIWLSALLKAQQ